MFLKTCTYDFILITETWLTSLTPDSFVCTDNFSLLRSDRTIGRGGGVLALIRKTISWTSVQLESFESFEFLCFDAKFKTDKLRFACFYCPPLLPENDKKKICSTIDKICLDSLTTFIFGDFNEPLIDWTNADPAKYSLVECSYRNILEQLIESPTRKQNILDLVFSTRPDLVSHYSVLPPFSSSDHSSIEVCLTVNSENVVETAKRDFYRADYHSIIENLRLIDWPILFSSCVTIEDFWKSFSDVLESLIETFVPLKKGKVKCKTPIFLRKLLIQKKKLWKKLKTGEKIELRTKYNQCLRQIKGVIIGDKIAFEKKLIGKDPNSF